jgi:ribonuclease HI
MTEPESSPPRITIYTDGGADPNPGTGGWAAILVDEATHKVKELSGGEPRATNNRMELTAAIRGLEALKLPCKVKLFTDSQYLKKGITEWLPGWIARGWKRKEGVLQNEDLWRRLAELVAQHEIHWGWVKGHAGHRWNEKADQLATAAIRAQRGAGQGPVPAPAAKPDAEVFLRVSCSGRNGGWAALLRNADGEQVVTGHKSGVTPNQLDLLAAADALDRLPPGISVAVHTGSDYLRNGAASWIAGWKKRGWKTQEGQPVSNRDLWQRLDEAMSRRRVTWPSVKDRDLPELEALGKPAKAAAQGSAQS